MDPARDPRQQRHLYSRNTTSPYGQTTFHQTQNRAPFPPSSHPPPSILSFTNHNLPSEPYYKQQRSYRQEAPPNHTRHQISASVCHAIPAHPSIPSLSSPQQLAPPRPHHNYAPLPCVPAGNVGPPSNFSGTRELPALPPIGGARAGGMAIADILGGPSSHESPSQYSSPVTTTGPIFSSTHASPRASSNRHPEYPQFRGPQTPEHSKKFDTRENKTNSSASPAQLGQYQTPEAQRYSTPQQHSQQSYSRPGLVHDGRRETARTTNPNPTARPKSQPNSFEIPQSCEPDRPPISLSTTFCRGADHAPRPVDSSNYGRTIFEDRERQKTYVYAERDQRERERLREIQREQDALAQRDWEKDRDRENQMAQQREKEQQRQQQEQRERAEQVHLQRELSQKEAERKVGYSRPPEPRERPNWMQHGVYEPPGPAYEPIPEREVSISRRPSNGPEHPTTTAPPYSGQPSYAPTEQRFYPITSTAPRNNSNHDELMPERRGPAQQQHQQNKQSIYNATLQNGPQQPHETPVVRPAEEPQNTQRSFLGVQEINRKGRVSPLPQAVQGAQSQADGPSGEPSIKNEFGRMFSGIGSGVGSVLQIPSPTNGQNHAVITGFRREDMETLQELQSIYKPQLAQGAKRRKHQKDEKADEENIPGQNSPNGRLKRTKTGHHFHHHRRADLVENSLCSSQSSLTPFRSAKGSLQSLQDHHSKPSTNLHHHHVPTRHHHHHPPNQPTSSKDQASTPILTSRTIMPLPKLSILNDAVLSSVSALPRHHLGHGYYCSTLRASSNSFSLSREMNSNRGFASVPEALPLFAGRENCTYTVKIPRVYLGDFAREEVTSRKAIWGTDIYTDDSDVLAACIHAGWFRGAWSEDVDVSLLGLELKNDENDNAIPPDDIIPGDLLENPSDKGPGHVPSGCDCHVTVLILPLLDRYSSSTRFGIKSREWGVKRDGWKGIHDGLSFMIKSIRFVSGVDGEEGRSGRSRRKIVGRQLQEKKSNNRKLPWVHGNRVGLHNEEKQERKRGRIERFGEMKGLGKGGWWKGKETAMKSKNIMVSDKVHISTGPVVKLDPPVVSASASESLVVSNAVSEESDLRTTTNLPSPSSLSPVSLATQRSTFIGQITQCMIRNANQAL